MGEVRWIKITTTMFDDEKIKVIQKMPEGANILLIWIKLLTLAGKCNASGYIYLAENIPYTDEMLAIIFDMQLVIVRLALNTFAQFLMIEINGCNMIRIINWDKHQNIEGLDKIREQNRLRKEKQRQIQKSLPDKNTPKIGGMDAICNYCGATGLSLNNYHIDHIVPLVKMGAGDIENKVIACKSCNSSKKDKELAEFLNDCINYGFRQIDINLIMDNPKLNKHLDFINGQFVTRQSRDSHAIDIDKELDIEKENNTYVSSAEPTPYKQIQDLFNSTCITLPKIKEIKGNRKKALSSRWKEEPDIEYWKELFKSVQESDFLTGRCGSWNGCSFDWIIKPANIQKIVEGNYINKTTNVKAIKKIQNFEGRNYEPGFGEQYIEKPNSKDLDADIEKIKRERMIEKLRKNGSIIR
jgi:predicted phage replisome organizer